MLSNEASIREILRLGSVGTIKDIKDALAKKSAKENVASVLKNGFVCSSAWHFGRRAKMSKFKLRLNLYK